MSRYDRETLQKLAYRYGADRALVIQAGQDAATNADLAAWKRLCEAGEPKRDHEAVRRSLSPTDRVMTYAARSVPTNVIAIRTGIPEAKVIEIIEAHA